jgi:hypothetical protein
MVVTSSAAAEMVPGETLRVRLRRRRAKKMTLNMWEERHEEQGINPLEE